MSPKLNATVPAVAPPAVPEGPDPRAFLADSYAQGVWIPLWQNLFGGFGVSIVLGVILYVTTEWPIENIVETALLSGLLVFGAAMGVRSFRDEFRFIVAALGEKRDLQLRAALQSEINRLNVEIEELRGADKLKSYYETLAAAESLLRAAYEGKEVSRSAAMDRGMTRAEWEAAVEMCKGAKVFDGRGKPVDGLSFDTAWATVMHFQNQRGGQYIVARDGIPVKVKV